MRHNEVTRVASVLALLRDGDHKAAIDALMLLWSEPPERAGIDTAAGDAWEAIREAGVVDAAVAAGLARMRDGTRIRIHAFVDLTEQLSEDGLCELANLVLASNLSLDPYLAAVFLRFAEHNYRRGFERLLAQHGERFETDHEAWQLAAIVMCTSRIGDRDTLVRWFASWRGRPVKMWVVAAYVAAAILSESMLIANLTTRNLKVLIKLAREALELPWDDSAAVFVSLRLLGDLHENRWDDFVAGMSDHRELLATAEASSRLDHPIARFANGLKHAHPVIGFQLDAPRAPIPGATDPNARLRNRQLAEVVADLASVVELALPLFDLIIELDALPRRDPRVTQLMWKMAELQESGGLWVGTTWERLVRERGSWLQRARFALTPKVTSPRR